MGSRTAPFRTLSGGALAERIRAAAPRANKSHGVARPLGVLSAWYLVCT
ncbi:hypothetical protein [Proteus terrae]|nr:hypothetical protein [Proteus terrae]